MRQDACTKKIAFWKRDRDHTPRTKNFLNQDCESDRDIVDTKVTVTERDAKVTFTLSARNFHCSSLFSMLII